MGCLAGVVLLQEQILVSVQLETKSIAGSTELVESCITAAKELRLAPRPPILGFVPSMSDKRRAIHKNHLQQLPAIANELQINLYPKVRVFESRNTNFFAFSFTFWAAFPWL
jgi:chromosome partitioning protein